ncbi:MAG: hypothetical protein E6927_06385 [Klebsiella michiganensis]|nr:hypothetical protein [Klebsiella michiganensis]
MGPDPRNFNQRVSLGRNDLLIRTFLSFAVSLVATRVIFELIMVSFKNNEYLRRICEASEAKKTD